MNNKLFHNNEAYQDLSIDNEIFDIINKTITKIGSKKLRNRLQYCSTDVNYLEELALKNYSIQQDLIYRFDMEQYLAMIRDLEISMDDWMLETCDKNLLYSWDFLNNRYFLTISNKLKFSSLLIMIVIYILIYLYLYYNGFKISISDYVKGIVIGYYKFIELMCRFITNNAWFIEWTALILTSAYVCYQIYSTYQTVNTNYEHYALCNSFYEEYEKIRRYIDIVKNMCRCEIYCNTDDVKESLNYLEYYFTNDASLGFSLITKSGTDDYVKHIDVLANFVGRVDCQICITKLLDDGYVIPKFVRSAFPILHVDGVWNPIIPLTNRVKNSLILNVTKPNVMIITGPNKAGKSTFMRSIITSVYLSQSLGITCCDKMALTPFRDIFTYLNVPDCIGRESLFEAELNRCYNYIEKTESLRGFSIGIVDELFTGTNPREGKAASYAILKRIANNPTNITLISTHFHDVLTRLEKNKFIFSKFTARKTEDGFTYSYKMEDGTSNQCIALQLLKDRGFDKEIIDDAIDFVKNAHVN